MVKKVVNFGCTCTVCFYPLAAVCNCTHSTNLGSTSIGEKILVKILVKILTKILAKILSKSYNKKFDKSVVDIGLLF